MSGPIASAVVLPDADTDSNPHPASSPPNTLKRRQSSVISESAKRPRVDDDADTAATSTTTPKRRERGRERRLFGAVLGALSQAPTTAGQKRRSEIEKRQFAQRRQEDEESEARKAERLARRRVQRGKETRRFERHALQLRHDNMLHLAHFLSTDAQPTLYYRPWEMSSEEEERVAEQVRRAREVVGREREEFEQRRREEEEEEGRGREMRKTPDEWTYRGAVISDQNGLRRNANPKTGRAADSGNTNGRDSHTQDQEMQDGHAEDATTHTAESRTTEDPPNEDIPPHQPEANIDEPTKDADEEVVEAAEDTVIY